jgi:ABC-type antimicrobial peptide transport system permease subunit
VTMASIGLLIGSPAALMFTLLLARAMPNIQVSVGEPIAFIGAILITASVSILAAWLPSRAASRISPAEAMRTD